MFGSVALNLRTIEDYAGVAGHTAVRRLRDLAKPLQGVRVLNLSSPRASSAVRRLLQSAVPLLTDLGLDAYWQQVRLPAEFLEMDMLLRRALSGYAVPWTSKCEREWWQFNQANARLFDEDFDIVIVHHTASVGLLAALTQLRGERPPGVWMWDSHRDYRAALPEAWSVIRRHAEDFAVSIYDYKPFIRPDAPTKKKVVIPPGVDPLGPTNLPITPAVRETFLRQRGIDSDRPLIAQIVASLREDDPLYMLETFRLVRERHPDVQFVIADLLSYQPEDSAVVEELRARGREMGDVTVLADIDRIGNVELSAIREEADVLIHRGLPRGISLELLEEMWEGRPIVSGRSPMAEAVLVDGKNALLADTPEEQANAIVWLLEHPKQAAKLGAAAHRTIQSQYLITHYLEKELKLFSQVLGLRQTNEDSAA